MALEKVFDAIREALADDTIQFAGPRADTRHGAPPRITWRPIGGVHKGARGMSGGPKQEADLLRRELRVEVKVWGEDFAATESLLERFINALHYVGSHWSYKADQGEEDWDVGGDTAKGAVVSYLCTLEIPLPRTPAPTRPITAINVTTDIE